MPDLGVDTQNDSSDVLSTLDPIFNAPVGAAPTVKPPAAPGVRKPLVPELGLTPEQEKYAAAGAGAVAGAPLQRGLERAFPSEAIRTAQGVKTLSEQAKLEKLLRSMQEEELLRHGIKPSDIAGKPATSGTNWMRNWAGIDREIAGGVPEASAAYQRMKGHGPVSSKMTKKWGPSPAGEPGQPKESLVDRLLRQSKEAEAAKAQTGAAVESAGNAARARLAEAIPGPLATAAKVLRSPFVQGPLAGAAAGMSFYEAYQRFLAGDRSGAVIDALGGTGAIMSMIPGLQLPGLAMAVGAPAAQYVKQGLQNPESVRGANQIQLDPMGNPVGP
jgi:hypothetical protein